MRHNVAMENASEAYIVVVDSGGTTIKSAVFTTKGDLIDTHVLEESGYIQGDIKSVANTICLAILALLNRNSIKSDSTHIIAGISGINTQAAAALAVSKIKRQVSAQNISVVNDADLIGLSSQNDATIVIICGTGSSIIGYYQGRGLFKCSGVNEILSDDGSAYWIGRKMMRAATKALDGRTEPSALTEAVLAKFDANHTTSLQLTIEASKDIKRTVASVATLLTPELIARDPLAKQIADTAVQEMLCAAIAVRSQLPVPEKEAVRVRFTGGVLAKNDYIFDELLRNLNSHKKFAVDETVVNALEAGYQLALSRLSTS